MQKQDAASFVEEIDLLMTFATAHSHLIHEGESYRRSKG